MKSPKEDAREIFRAIYWDDPSMQIPPPAQGFEARMVSAFAKALEGAHAAGRREGIEEAALLMENLWEKAETPGMALLGKGAADEIRALLKTDGGNDGK